jgi:hypothetical protein
VYRLFCSQVEYCTNLIFQERTALDRVADRLLDLNRSIGRPDKLSNIFGHRIPEPYAVAARGQSLTVRGERNAIHKVSVPLEGSTLGPPGGDVPQSNLVVSASRTQRFPVRTECDRIYGRGVAWPVTVCAVGCWESTSYSQMLPSSLPAASVFPSGLKLKDVCEIAGLNVGSQFQTGVV